MIHPYDDSDFQQSLSAFRAYLAQSRNTLDVSRIAYEDGTGHRDRKPAKERKQSALAKHRSEHVYLLPAGAHRQRGQPSTRQGGAPIWTTIEAA